MSMSERNKTWAGKPAGRRWRFGACGLGLALCCLLVPSFDARSQGPGLLPRRANPASASGQREDLSGRFTFARIRFDVGAGWAGLPLGDHGPPWSHDYPEAGLHLMRIISELSRTDVTLDQNEVIVSFDDPELFKYPLAYLCEVGFMHLSDKEIAGMREYCLRGGFLIVDDFRGYDLYNLTEHLKRAFPEYQLKELDLSHPIFNCFFSIETLDVAPPYGRLQPKFYGLEDSTGRLMMIVNYNNDVSDYWQWSNDPFRPIAETNEAYKFGVNYIMYALTH
jgi:hypothetical protein